jgi:hypothetical protein
MRLGKSPGHCPGLVPGNALAAADPLGRLPLENRRISSPNSVANSSSHQQSGTRGRNETHRNKGRWPDPQCGDVGASVALEKRLMKYFAAFRLCTWAARSLPLIVYGGRLQFKKFFTGMGPAAMAVAGGALLATGICVAPAMADQVLPSYTVGGGCTAGPDFVPPGPFCSQALAGGTDTLLYNLTPVPSLSVTATAVDDPLSDLAYSGVLSLSYSFEVLGGKAGDIVPLLIATDLFTSDTGYGNAYASITVTTSQDNLSALYCSVAPGFVPCAAPSFSGTISASATSGTVDTLTLLVEAGAALGNDGVTTFPSSASASADPFIYVDPSFVGAANYEILASPGIGNAAVANPEPSTLLLIFVLSPLVLLGRRLRIARVD